MPATAQIDGMDIVYEVIDGGPGRDWVITPGGRFSKDDPGVRELGAALVERGGRALIWDRPNTGASSVCFRGPTESHMQADTLAGLLRHLGFGATVIVGGSGGARVSLLTAANHPDVAAGLGLWWISGGVLGNIMLGVHYCGGSISAAWRGGMEAVAELPEWSSVIARNPDNRERFLDLDPAEFITTLERWMVAYCPCDDAGLVAGLSAAEAQRITVPALVLRSGSSDYNHPTATSRVIAESLPHGRLVEPPWGEHEWMERQAARNTGEAGGLFVRWPLVAQPLLDWADEAIPS